jgi:hypothetical protein
MKMRLSLLLLAGLILAGCSTPAPMVDYDSSYDFSQDKTFAFISEHPLIRGEGAEGGNPMVEGRLVQITANIMAARGFTQISNPEEADLAVGFTLGGREKIQVNSYPEYYRGGYNSWGWGGGYHGGYGGYGGYGGSSVDVRQYTEGVLSVDIYDPQERRPVWHGRATRRITKKMEENVEDTLQEVLGNIFSVFPPSR